MKDFGLTVFVTGNEKEHLNNALKRFKRRVEKSKVLDIYKDKQQYTKPSDRKKYERKKSY